MEPKVPVINSSPGGPFNEAATAEAHRDRGGGGGVYGGNGWPPPPETSPSNLHPFLLRVIRRLSLIVHDNILLSSAILSNTEKEQKMGLAIQPDSFPYNPYWAAHMAFSTGQPDPELSVRVIDVAPTGERHDHGHAPWDGERLNSVLSQRLPEQNGSCRVVIGTAESGRLDRSFVMRAVNLSGERLRGQHHEKPFGLDHFQSWVHPSFDLWRLRRLWEMPCVEWRPLSIEIPKMLMPPPFHIPYDFRLVPGDMLFAIYEVPAFLASMSWVTVQAIPLEGDRFMLFLGLPSRRLNPRSDKKLYTAEHAREMVEEQNPLLSTEVFESVAHDAEQTCRDIFEQILLSPESAVQGAQQGNRAMSSSLMCRLLLVDVLRAMSDTWTRFHQDATTRLNANNTPAWTTPPDPRSALKEIKLNCIQIDRLLMCIETLQKTADHILLWINEDYRDDESGLPSRLRSASLALNADAAFAHSVLQRIHNIWDTFGDQTKDYIERIYSRNIGRLTLVAAIFLPLSFGADILGMQFRIHQLGYILYDYLGLVIVCGLVVFVFYRVIPVFREQYLPAKRRTVKSGRFVILASMVKLHLVYLCVPPWIVLAVSFLFGMTEDVPASVKVLKYGSIGVGGVYLIILGVFLMMLTVEWAIVKTLRKMHKIQKEHEKETGERVTRPTTV